MAAMNHSRHAFWRFHTELVDVTTRSESLILSFPR